RDPALPLGIKLIVPVMLITIAGTASFGFLLAQQVQRNIETSDEGAARRLADSAVSSVLTQGGNPSAINYSLLSVSAGEPDVIGIWVVDARSPGYPVVASSIPSDVGKQGTVQTSHAMLAQGGSVIGDRSVGGTQVLEAVEGVPASDYAVVVWISLANEQAAIGSTLIWVSLVALVIAAIEVGALMTILEFGVFRRIRRIGDVFDSFAVGKRHIRL